MIQKFTSSKVIVALLCAVLPIVSLAQEEVVFIPDANFKAALLANSSINWNGDGEIQQEEAVGYYGAINVSGRNIADLTGIEAFPNVGLVNCSNNQLTTLDLRSNYMYPAVDCSNNKLTSLLISSSTSSLHCENNLLTTLDLRNRNELSYVYCQNNRLQELLLTEDNTGQYYYWLSKLWCQNNQLTSLSLKKALVLNELRCEANKLNALDASQNRYLATLICNSNELASLNIQNNNTQEALNNFDAIDNPDLGCVQVNDIIYAEANWSDSVDEGVRFSRDCSGTQVVSIPDANFKAALVANSSINTNGDGEIQVQEAEVVEALNVPNQNIADLSGISAFASITNLNCSGNALTALDLRSNKLLTQLRCYDNQLTSLNVSGLSSLAQLRCNNNNLTSLNVASNTGLTSLRCQENQLTSLDVSVNIALAELECSNNRLTYLNVKNGNNVDFTLFDATENPDIACVKVDDVAFSEENWSNKIDDGVFFSTGCFVTIPDANFKNALVSNFSINTNRDSEIDISEALAFKGTINVQNKGIQDMTGIEAFTSMTGLNCSFNKIKALDIGSNKSLKSFSCGSNQLSEIDLRNNLELTFLSCGANQIAALDVSFNTMLKTLWCSGNPLTELNVSNNASMTNLAFSNTPISTVDLSALSELQSLDCSSTQLTSLDLTSNIKLEVVFCSNGRLANLNIGNSPALNLLYCHHNQLTSLDLRSSPNLKNLECHFNQLTSLLTSGQQDEVWCNNNKLTNLNINSYYLFCENNQITSLKGSIIGGALHCWDNLLDSLDLSDSKQLQFVQCRRNRLTYLNLKTGSNQTMWVPEANENPDLTCVEVDDPAFSEANWRSGFDPQVSFSTDCSGVSAAMMSAEETESELSISPNPTSGGIQISSETPIDQVTVYDAIGGKIQSIPFNGSEGDMSQLPKGIYILNVHRGTKVHSIRVIKK